MHSHTDHPVGRIIAARLPRAVLDVGAGHGGSLSWLVSSVPPAAGSWARVVAGGGGALVIRDATAMSPERAAGTATLAGPRFTTPAFQLVRHQVRPTPAC